MGLDVRAQYFWWGPAGGAYVRQGIVGVDNYPSCLPPLTCDRPMYAPFLVAHWAYALAIDPRLVIIVPTYTSAPTGQRRWDGGFQVVLSALPLERLRVPQFSGSLTTYVPI